MQQYSPMNHYHHLSPPVFPDPWASDYGEDCYGLWQAFSYRDIRLAFRWLPPDSFEMGSPETEPGRYDDEDLHLVTLSQGFWLAETTVPQALWKAVMADNPSDFNGDNRPVELVSWNDAQEFIKQLNQSIANLLTRLPWEAEWEYACRAGTQTAFNFKDELNLSKVNYRGTWKYESEWGESAKQETAEVKSYPCNDWGLYEMHGNVWEWCEDVWQAHLGHAETRDPWYQQGSTGVAARVVRGGSWGGDGGSVRSAIRIGYAPDNRNGDLGFRLALGHAGSGQGSS